MTQNRVQALSDLWDQIMRDVTDTTVPETINIKKTERRDRDERRVFTRYAAKVKFTRDYYGEVH